MSRTFKFLFAAAAFTAAMAGTAAAADFGADIDRAPLFTDMGAPVNPIFSNANMFSNRINFEGHALTTPMKSMAASFATHNMSACDAGKCPSFNVLTTPSAPISFAKDPTLAAAAMHFQ